MLFIETIQYVVCFSFRRQTLFLYLKQLYFMLNQVKEDEKSSARGQRNYCSESSCGALIHDFLPAPGVQPLPKAAQVFCLYSVPFCLCALFALCPSVSLSLFINKQKTSLVQRAKGQEKSYVKKFLFVPTQKCFVVGHLDRRLSSECKICREIQRAVICSAPIWEDSRKLRTGCRWQEWKTACLVSLQCMVRLHLRTSALVMYVSFPRK